MLFQDVLLGDRQAPGLAEDRVRDADLADVVQQAGESDRTDEVGVEVQLLGEEDRVAGDVL